jgi:hypothetical protein
MAEMTFSAGEEFITGRLGTAEGVAVPTLNLRQLLQKFPWKGATLVCDIEGSETRLVENEGELLARYCTTLVIEVHPELRTESERDLMFTRLASLGFTRVASLRKVHAFRHTSSLLPDLSRRAKAM